MNELQKLRQLCIDAIKRAGERAGGIDQLSVELGYSRYYLSKTMLPRAESGMVSTDTLWSILGKIEAKGY